MMNLNILLRFYIEMRGAMHMEVNVHACSAGVYTDSLYTYITWLRFFLLLLSLLIAIRVRRFNKAICT